MSPGIGGEAALAQLEGARALLDKGDFAQAERIYRAVLDRIPGETEATNFLSMQLLARGQKSDALKLLEQAIQLKPGDSVLRRSRGLVHLQANQLDEALIEFRDALKLAPDHYIARLLLGDTLARMGNSHGALVNYFGALVAAQLKGQWRDLQTTPPWQRQLVAHATAYVVAGRRELFSRCLEPLRATYGRDTLTRVEAALSMYLLDVAPSYQDDRQRPSFLYIPELPTHPYFDPQKFDWVAELELKTADIRAELSAVLASGEKLDPFHDIATDRIPDYLGGTSPTRAWDTYFFYRHGILLESHGTQSPLTLAALDALPLTRIRDHAPESLFSVLRPGTEIKPHRGVTNARLVVHLPLVIPEDCALSVGGEMHVWKEGQVVIFDDTFEHAAWNRSEHVRSVLIADVWNPYLDKVEQQAIGSLIAAIGDFNQDCGINKM